MNYSALKLELTTDPASRGYAGKTEAQLADLLNTPATDTLARGQVGKEDLVGDLGLLMKTLTQAKYDTSNPAKQAEALFWLELYDRTLGEKQWVNMQSELVIGFFDTLQTQGWLTQQQHDDLFVWTVSRAEKLLGRGVLVTADDVRNAQKGEWG